jgi:RimJ/RimL family protein N-acetyltransferase
MSASKQIDPLQQSELQISEEDVRFHLMHLVNNPMEACNRFNSICWLREIFSFSAWENQVHDNNNNSPPLPEVILKLMLLACEQLSDWPLEIYLRKKIQKSLNRPDNSNADEILHISNNDALICAYVKNGQIDLGHEEALKCVLTWPHNERLSLLYHFVNEKHYEHPYHPSDLTSNELSLTPLKLEHLEAFAWQYSEPSVAELCNLPMFDSDSQWQNWLNDNTEEQDQYLYAVIHHNWGFIGSVAIRIRQGIGFFYYWLGKDFQRKSFGPLASKILFHISEKYHGMSCCYAKVYPYNFASIKALGKLGFHQLPYSMPLGEENELLFYLGPNKSKQKQFAEAQNVFIPDDASQSLIPWSFDGLL